MNYPITEVYVEQPLASPGSAKNLRQSKIGGGQRFNVFFVKASLRNSGTKSADLKPKSEVL